MRARSVVAVVVCSAVLFACSNKASPKRQDASASGAFLPAATDAAGADTAATAVGDVPPETIPGNAADAPTVDVEGARDALDRYLDALAANDFSRALTVSQDAPRSLTVVRSIVNAANDQRDGTTSSTYSKRSFDAASATADEVRFTGRAVLDSLVSGPAGPPVLTTDTFTDLVVRRSVGGWRVAEAIYNDAPMVSHAASSTMSVGAVQVTLSGSLAFGNSLAVVVQLVASGDHSVGVGQATVRVNDEAATATSSFVVSGQPGFVYTRFPRRDDRPTEWRATITVDEVAQEIALTF